MFQALLRGLTLTFIFTITCQAVTPLRAFKEGLERGVRRHSTFDAPQIQDIDPDLLYPAYNISIPIDHFHNETKYEPHTNGTFNLRYWFDATYYKDGGPVIVLQGGETDGADRLPYLQKGILHDLAVATNGIGVVIEHRYYGSSFPTPDLSTENLRFLTTAQALADQAYFAQHVVFKGLEDKDLTAPNTPYIGYGGSYAGAFVAFLRKLYPDVFWGTISSSGVTEAIFDYWIYFEPIRDYADADCVKYTQKITNANDNILSLGSKNTTTDLKTVWGLPNVTYDNDFANVLSYGIQGWQSRNWDPEVTSLSFSQYCGNITTNSLLYPDLEGSRSSVEALLALGGYKSEISSLITPYLNWIGWLAEYTSYYGQPSCAGQQDYCFSNHNVTFLTSDDLSQDWRAWPYQYCTEWGYLATGSGVPDDQLPLISRLIDIPYLSLVCEISFNITTPPNVNIINDYGGFNISYPRLAFIDGEQDPWRPATPHASPYNSTAYNRTSSDSEPFILIQGAVHHWDENGLFPNETVTSYGNTSDSLPPIPVKKTQKEEIRFVLEWMEEWENYLLGKTHRISRELR